MMSVFPLARLVASDIPAAAGPINVNPNDNGLPGIAALRTIVGAVMTVGLILSVLALVVAAVVWAFGSHSANPHLATRGKTGVLIACGAAIITDRWAGLQTFFAPGVEILPVESTEDVVAALTIADADLRRIGEAARQRVLAEHTSDRRAEEFERLLAGLGGEARPRLAEDA